MGFGINVNNWHGNGFDRELYYAILEAESKGLETITIDSKNRINDEIRNGQIIEFVSKDEIEPKNVYVVDEVIAKHSENKMVLSITNKDYVPKKEIFISQQELYETINEYKEKGYEVGKFFVGQYNRLGKITGFIITETTDEELTYKSKRINPHSRSVLKDIIKVEYFMESSGVGNRYTEETGFKSEKPQTESLEVMVRDFVMTDFADLSHLLKENDHVFSLEENYSDTLRLGIDDSVDESNFGLVGFGDTKHMSIIAQSMELKVMRTNAHIKLRLRGIDMIKEDMDVKMSKIKLSCDLVKDRLSLVVADMNVKIKSIMRLVTTLEIFSGVTEDIMQIKEGENSQDTVIHLMQRKLFMDEEVGIYEDGGVNFESIDKFDEWLIESGNIDKLIPFERGILMMSPRRVARDYDVDNVFLKAMMQDLDKKIYVIMKNGDNVYRLWTDKIEMHVRLFPMQQELQQIIDRLQENQRKVDDENVDDVNWGKVKNLQGLEKVKDDLFFYQRNFLLIQGVLARTEIFPNIPPDFTVFNVDSHDGYIKYVYDEDGVLATGKPTFGAWLKSVNSGVKRGKKILVFASEHNTTVDIKYRFNVEWNQYDRPALPPYGIYTVKSDITKYKKIKEHKIPEAEFLANPDKWVNPNRHYHLKQEYIDKVKHVVVQKANPPEDEIEEHTDEQMYISFFNEKKNKYDHVPHGNRWLRFRIEATDDIFIHYEEIDKTTLDHYLNDRESRRHYAKVIPLLKNIELEINKENAIEEHYIKMIVSKVKSEFTSSVSDSKIMSEVKLSLDKWRSGVVYENNLNTLKAGSIDERNSVSSIYKEAIRTLKKKYKIDASLGVNSKIEVQCFKHKNTRDMKFYMYGATKKKFVDSIKEVFAYDDKVTKKLISSVVGYEKEDANIIKLCKDRSGVLINQHNTGAVGSFNGHNFVDIDGNIISWRNQTK
jgi:hypothetical protein